MAALAQLGVVFVFTDDSIGLGEDGPTHQPIEHLASRSVRTALDRARMRQTMRLYEAAREDLLPTIEQLTTIEAEDF